MSSHSKTPNRSNSGRPEQQVNTRTPELSSTNLKVFCQVETLMFWIRNATDINKNFRPQNKHSFYFKYLILRFRYSEFMWKHNFKYNWSVKVSPFIARSESLVTTFSIYFFLNISNWSALFGGYITLTRPFITCGI